MSMRVWTPFASRVDLVLASGRQPMIPVTGGWWRSAGPAPEPGSDYAFAVDDGPALPDPRGERQPHGIHGPSQRVDHTAFEWHDQDWQPTPLREAVIYELHVGTFSPEGTFDAAIARLDHLVGLGITHVELMPVHAFPGRQGWGYDVAGFYAVHEPYGGPDGLKRFVDACHGHGLGVLLDVVYNHLGPEGCYLGSFGPYVTDRFRTPWGGAVNLGEAGADEVRAFIIENALMWLRDYHVDGLRIDAVHAFVDLTATHLLEELALATAELAESLGRELALIAESDLNDPRVVRPRAVGGFGMDAQWSDDFHHALHTTLTGERNGYYEDFAGFPDLVTALTRGWVYEGRYSRHRGRRHGASADDIALDRFVGYAQNHDQVGNRAQGERLSQLVGPEALRVAAALVLCGPFVPLLFQGEEWGAGSPFLFFTDYGDESLLAAVREGRRREFAAFGWRPEELPDPQARATFEASRLDWVELEREPHASLLEWHRRLIELRRSASFAMGERDRPEVRASSEEGWLVVRRGSLAACANLSASDRRLDEGVLPPGELVLATTGVVSGGAGLGLPAMSAAVLRA
ncbi:malto-oligosyltrehalose trehalohydrolase [soil metagenome]